MTRSFLLAALLLLAPLAGAAQGEVHPAQRIAAARSQAASAGIPTALLDNKVAEGNAKGVPLDRIAEAVERRLAALTRARDVMGRGLSGAPLSAGDLRVGADAIESGVTPEVLGAVSAGAPAEQRAVAVAVLTQLVREGTASEVALERVQQALSRGPEALRRLPGDRARGGEQEGPPAGRGPGAQARGRGGAHGGPPAAVPEPGEKPTRRNGKGRGRP